MTIDIASLPYRPCVGLMLVNGEGKVFVGKRIDIKEGDSWQMPQGGIDKGEDARAAAFRELGEETGIDATLVTLLAAAKEEQFYDLPDDVAGKLWGGRYKGQRQTWVLMRFTGSDADVRLDAHDPPEFLDWKWVEPDDLIDLIVPFKRRVYRAVLDEFRALI